MAISTDRRLRPGVVPGPVRDVLERLGRAGHRSWLVGGVVRDLLLARARHDPGEFDVATPATPAEVQALFRKVIPTGIDHGTVTVVAGGLRVEVTTFRGEGDYEDGRRPSQVTFHGDLGADLSRRDFTVNAMAWDPLAGELRDPFGGRADLARGRIRAVGDPAERFAEDGLRPLRGVRFVSQLGFRLAPGTRAAIPGALPVVARVSRERVSEELSRLLVGPHAVDGLRALRETGLLPVVLPRLAALPPGRVGHAIAVAASSFPACRRGQDADRRERCRLLRLSGLLHVLPPDAAAEEVVALRLPGRLAAGVLALAAVGCAGAAPLPDPRDPVAVRRWMSAIGRERIPLVLELLAADARHQGARTGASERRIRTLRTRVGAELRGGAVLSVAELAVGGREVMALLPDLAGPEVGEALRFLLDEAIRDPACNVREALLARLRDRPAFRAPRSGDARSP